MKKTEYQSSFTAGELDPKLYGQVDLGKYKTGLKTAHNCIISPLGPAIRRNGTKYINSVKTPSKKTRLIRFIYDTTYAYILEMGETYIRFYRNGARLEVASVPVEVTTPYLESELFEVSYTQFGNTIYFSHENYATSKLVWSNDSTWTFSTVNFYPPATTEAGWKAPTTMTPGATTGLGITFTAGSAVLEAAYIGRQIQNLTGAGKASIVGISSTTVCTCDIIENFPSTSAMTSGNWKFDASPIAKIKTDGFAEGSEITIDSYNTDSTLGTPITITGITNANPGVVTAAAHGYANGDRVYITGVAGMTQVNNRIWTAKGVAANTFNLANDDNVNFDTTNYTAYASGGYARRSYKDIGVDAFQTVPDVGTYLIFNDGVAYVTAVSNAQREKAVILSSMATTDPTSNWSSETSVWNSTDKYPRTVALYQQRLWLSSNTGFPQTTWASRTGDFENFARGSQDDAALDLVLSTREINRASWAVGLKDFMVIGTTSSELTIGSSLQSVITPTTVTQNPRTYNGSSIQTPLVLGNEIIYFPRNNRKILSFYYDFTVDTFKSVELTFLAQHLPANGTGIIELAYADFPNGIIYAVLADGTMMAGTYEKEQEVMAWTLQSTDGSYESVQTLATSTTTEVWVVVKRTVGGSTVRYLERFDNGNGESNTDGFSDAYLTYSVPKTITGITQASPGVITSAAHGFSNGDLVRIFSVSGMTQVNGHTYKVAGVSANTFQLTDQTTGANIDTTSYTTYTSGGSVYKLVSTLSGLSHLEGKTVQVKLDGGVHPDAVVSGGVITLSRSGYEAVVGLPYTTTIETLAKEYNIGLGTQQGQQVTWVRPILRLYKSALPFLNGEFIPARDAQDNMDYKLGLYSGDAFYGPLTWSSSASLSIALSSPFPLAVCGIFGSLNAGTQ